MIESFGHGSAPNMTRLHVDALNEAFTTQAAEVANHNSLQELFQTGGLEGVLGNIASRPPEAKVNHSPAFNELKDSRPDWVDNVEAAFGDGEQFDRKEATMFGGDILDLLDVAEPKSAATTPEAQAAAAPAEAAVGTVDFVPVLQPDGTVTHQMVHK